MSYSIFYERNNKPSEEEVTKALGNKLNQWFEISSYLVNVLKARSSYKFYGKNYGWAKGYSKKGKSIVSLYPLLNDFTIQIILKKSHEVEIVKTIDNKDLIDIINQTAEIYEGKWIFIEYSKINSVDIIKKMIDIKVDDL